MTRTPLGVHIGTSETQTAYIFQNIASIQQKFSRWLRYELLVNQSDCRCFANRSESLH